MKSYFLKALLLLLLPVGVWAQQQNDTVAVRAKLDSLEQSYINAKGDSASKSRLEDLMLFYFRNSPGNRESSLGDIQSIIQKKGDLKLSYLLLMYRVFLTHTPDSIISTRKYISEYLEQCLKYDDKKGYVTGLITLSQSESYAGNYNEALKLLLQSLDYARDTMKDNEMMGGAFLTLGIFYYNQRDTLRAIEFNKKSLKAYSIINNTENMASVNNNLGMQYSDLGLYDSAKVYFRESIRLFQISDKAQELANPLCNLALALRLTKDYDSAVYYARESIRSALNINFDESLAGAYYILAQTFRDISEQDSALLYYNRAKVLFEKTNSQSALRDFYPDMAAFYASAGHHKLAYEYLLKATVIKDSVFNTDNNKVLKEMDAKYETGRKEQEILKQEEQIKRQRIINYSAMAVAAFFLLLLFFIYRSNRLKQKSNKLLAIAKDKAEQSEKFKQQFLANMSHEIRTPMNAVMGMTNLLIDKNPRSDQVHYLEGIQKSSLTLLHIINDILDLSKIEAGKMELEQIDFSIEEVVEQVRQTLIYKAEEKGIQLLMDISSEVPAVVTGDPVRLNQVLINLAGNAIKFTERGSVMIVVTTDTNGIKFSIVDTGIGIPADKLQSVFESFSQANASDTRKFGGTGLGLSISKQLVELMGGVITIESTEGSGTSFSFVIDMPVGSRERMISQNAAQQLDCSILNGLKILITDDNEYNRIVAHDTLLSKADVEITLAVNGKEALKLTGEKDFDVILMDVQMPVMDGYEATRQIRNPQSVARNHTIPVIALTASVVRSDLDKCRQAGMTDYVPKPFHTAQLISAIAKATGREIKFTENNTSLKQQRVSNSSITNMAYLEKFCEGDKVRMQKYIALFTASVPALVDKINTALINNDFEEIANHIHGFKTKWIMMGMNISKDLALKIEMQCRQPIPGENVKQDISMLMEQVRVATVELDHY